MLDSLVVFATQKANDFSSGAVTTIDREIIRFFNQLWGSNGWGNFLLSLISIVLCIILVGIIGYQREAQGHNAGFRTHILLGIGSCVIMLFSIYAVGATETNFETMRLSASVAPGIGFIGAGVIIKNKGAIRGLTTAATLWVSMAIGLACGSGNFVIAILGAIATYLCLFLFYKVEIKANRNSSKIYIYLDNDSKLTYDEISKVIESYSYTIRTASLQNANINGSDKLLIVIEFASCSNEGLKLLVRDLKIKYNPFDIAIEIKKQAPEE